VTTKKKEMSARILWSSVFCLAFLFSAQGQNWRSTPNEIYGGITLSSYFGDIGGWPGDNSWYGIRDLDIARTRPGISAGFRHIPMNYISFNGSLVAGWLSGSDRGGKNRDRGYRFNTVFIEPSLRTEFLAARDRPLFGRRFNRRGLVRNYATFSAYLFGGVGAAIYHVMPNELLADRQQKDGIEYSPVAIVLPAGLGVKLGIRNYTDLGLEVGGRYALNDYIDGLTTGISTSNDIYYITSVNMVFRLPGQRTGPN
jgi:hypothetical protein